MSADEEGSRDRLEIDWPRAAAGALAAVVSAVLLSAFGELGTLLGAALGSLVLTIGSALFTQGIRSSGRTLAKAQATAKQKVGIAKAEVRRAERSDDPQVRDSHLEAAGDQLAEAEDELAEADQELDEAEIAAAPVTWRERLAGLPWRRVLLVSLALFLAAMTVITVFELIAGRSVASYTGGSDSDSGTTIGQVTHDGGKQSPSPTPSESPTPAAPTAVVPPPVGSLTSSPSANPSVTPSESVSVSPSVAPSGAPAPASSSTP